ncbi:MAG: cobalt-precorrin-8 methylmutase [Methanosphaera sp.]|uniref:cobalt-precorrin-8 methylmutase n=2 Tax=Methanosphaera sp. TaxID=2666342 RepID=UPI0025FF3B89|nr:cobalt-precorrin-8 methylmutase [Methanosphaera sp.]MCI5867291.1 cobalt-precorrin-8 methylmutase [Methanosphaera sp.]MDD6534641.1 cobalt-precorrin-8 methylmutase [Methanosphaera sp.]MDY3955691.1 cobalt-precorrin-8 methylmutase [Methanosphaera sp.]
MYDILYNMGASTKPGYDIANKSREIIKELIDDQTKDLTYEERDIVERVVHSTADPEYAKLVKISPDFVDTALKCFDDGKDILTDINMVKSGITRYEGDVMCYIRDERAVKLAKKEEITRSAAAMRVAAEDGFSGVVAIGNAPTALFEVMDLVEEGIMDAKAVVGVPVGFVGAADSKEALSLTEIPHVITTGPKGGTPIAVAVINSLLNIRK